MSICKGRTVSDSANSKFPFYDSFGIATNQYYFSALGCKNKAVSNELCGICLIKEEKLKSATINGNKLKDKDGKRIWQPRVLHGKIDEPIPSWSEIEFGSIYNARLKTGLKISTEMPRKKAEQTNSVVENSEKPKKRTTKKKEEVVVNNVLDELKPKMYIDTSNNEIVEDIIKVEVRPIKIDNKDYYYNPTKDKVYTLDFNYVGRYDKKNSVICTDYPDSDAEPSFT